MNWRSILFWKLDKYKNGGKVAKNLEQIVSLMKKDVKNDFHQEKVRRLIEYAVKNIPFYKKFNNKVELKDLPVVDKTLMRRNANQFINSASKNTLKKVSTSGSTGTPFSSFQNRGKLHRNTADTIYFGSLVGYKLGEKLLYIKLWNKANIKSKWTQFKQNIKCVDVTKQNSEYIKKTTVQSIEKEKGKLHLLAYASYYDQLLEYLSESGQEITNVQSVIAMSERLSLNTKKHLKNYLNVPVYSRYSNVENGIIAQQVPGSGNRFLVNTASYYVEILHLKNTDALGLGEVGRIVVTDIYNYGMPFIRYDTGDIGSIEYDMDTGSYYLTELHGRKMDLVYDTMGNSVSAMTINNNMLLFPEVIQYQFIQKSEKSYKFLLNIKNPPYKREAELKIFYQKIFGIDSSVSVEYVNEIPVLSSGKRKQVINKTL
jgi:phenylacetate-CoA ligase